MAIFQRYNVNSFSFIYLLLNKNDNKYAKNSHTTTEVDKNILERD